jgi:hypothetical protein
MKHTRQRDLETTSSETALKSALQTRPREQYLLEKDRIIAEIGSLEDVRFRLGLSQRKICQVLLVDPSAWTRWLKTGAPPHIHQALKWLLELKKSNPDIATPSNVSSRLDLVQASLQAKIRDLETNMESLDRALSITATSAATSATAPIQYVATPSGGAPDDSAVLALEAKMRAEMARIQDQLKVLINSPAKARLRMKAKRKPALKSKVRAKLTAKSRRKPRTKTQKPLRHKPAQAKTAGRKPRIVKKAKSLKMRKPAMRRKR